MEFQEIVYERDEAQYERDLADHRLDAAEHLIDGMLSDMKVRLKQIGFDTNMYWLHKPTAGIVGQEACVFAAVKPSAET